MASFKHNWNWNFFFFAVSLRRFFHTWQLKLSHTALLVSLVSFRFYKGSKFFHISFLLRDPPRPPWLPEKQDIFKKIFIDVTVGARGTNQKEGLVGTGISSRVGSEKWISDFTFLRMCATLKF